MMKKELPLDWDRVCIENTWNYDAVKREVGLSSNTWGTNTFVSSPRKTRPKGTNTTAKVENKK